MRSQSTAKRANVETGHPNETPCDVPVLVVPVPTSGSRTERPVREPYGTSAALAPCDSSTSSSVFAVSYDESTRPTLHSSKC